MIKDQFKLSLKYGLIGILLIIIMFFVFYFSDKNPLVKLQIFYLIIIPTFIIFELIEFTFVFNNKLLEFWHGMTSGFFMYMIIAIGFSIFVLTFIQLIDTEIFSNYVQNRLTILEGTRINIVEQMGADVYINSYKEVKEMTPYDLILDIIARVFLIGFVSTSIVSALLTLLTKNNKHT
ncbi:MAG: DUF4199 domain-containing protein [Reichenbachiella sp.]